MADIGILRAASRQASVLLSRSKSRTSGDDRQDARSHFREGLVKMPGGDGEAAGGIRQGDVVLPDRRRGDGPGGRAGRHGPMRQARVEYERARRLWSDLPPGLPIAAIFSAAAASLRLRDRGL